MSLKNIGEMLIELLQMPFLSLMINWYESFYTAAWW